MEILIKKVRRITILLIAGVLLLPSFSFATGADVTVTGVKNFKGDVVSKPLLQLYSPSILPANLIEENVWDFGNGSYGKGIGAGDNVGVYVRAWAEGAEGKGKHYGFLSGATSGPGDNASTISGLIIAKYRADKPFDPQITTVVNSTTRDMLKNTDKGTLTVKGSQKLPGTGEDAEISSYLWKYWKGNDAPTESKTNGDLVVANPAPGTYNFQLALENVWGQTGYSPAVSYNYGGGQGASSFTFNLIKNDTGKLAVNAISSPVATTANAVEAKIKGAGATVTAIAKWDAVNGSQVYLPGDQKDLDLAAGEAFQVYVDKPVTITLP